MHANGNYANCVNTMFGWACADKKDTDKPQLDNNNIIIMENMLIELYTITIIIIAGYTGWFSQAAPHLQ